ncbi:MAG: homocysteine S-methyltransferase [Candidatus Promineifilaceae bacterium]
MFLNPIYQFLQKQGHAILDGGLATELEGRGFDLADSLWSARLLIENPAAIAAVHSDYLAAGADVIITATYQATIQGLIARGLSRVASAELLQSAITLALNARNQFWQTTSDKRLRPLVAASVGPYGAYLANGAEYTGAYDLDRAGLVDFHRERWELLANSGADLLACETIPSFVETQALLDLLHTTPDHAAWISFSCRNGQQISDGTPIAACARLLEHETQVVAIGINCTRPEFVPSLIGQLREVTAKPIVVYPNSGEGWDAVNKCWVGQEGDSAEIYANDAQQWQTLGATLIGGCCRTTPNHIRRIRAVLC